MENPSRQIEYLQTGHLLYGQATHRDHFEKQVPFIRLERVRPAGVKKAVEEDIYISK